jgi:hypothetical protein
MFRVTTDEVNDIMTDSVSPSKDLTPHIETANLMVTEDLVGQGLSDARLKLIEKWLSAHFAAIDVEKGGLTRIRTGDASEGYTAPTRMGKGLEMTRYGQQVMMLDTTGILRSHGEMKARFTIL